MIAKILSSLLLIDALVLMLAVLLQAGKGGGLASSFGGSSSSDALFGARQAGDLLTRTTWWSAGIFIGLAFVMQLASAHTAAPTSVLDRSFTPTKSAPAAPVAPSSQAPAIPLPLQPQGDTKAQAPAKSDAKQPEPAKKP